MTVLQVILKWEITDVPLQWKYLFEQNYWKLCKEWTAHAVACARDNTHVIRSQFSFTHSFVTWPDLTFSIWVQDYARAKNKVSVYILVLLKLKAKLTLNLKPISFHKKFSNVYFTFGAFHLPFKEGVPLSKNSKNISCEHSWNE